MATDHERDERGLVWLEPGEVYEGPWITMAGIAVGRSRVMLFQPNRECRIEHSPCVRIENA